MAGPDFFMMPKDVMHSACSPATDLLDDVKDAQLVFFENILALQSSSAGNVANTFGKVFATSDILVVRMFSRLRHTIHRMSFDEIGRTTIESELSVDLS